MRDMKQSNPGLWQFEVKQSKNRNSDKEESGYVKLEQIRGRCGDEEAWVSTLYGIALYQSGQAGTQH